MWTCGQTSSAQRPAGPLFSPPAPPQRCPGASAHRLAPPQPDLAWCGRKEKSIVKHCPMRKMLSGRRLAANPLPNLCFGQHRFGRPPLWPEARDQVGDIVSRPPSARRKRRYPRFKSRARRSKSGWAPSRRKQIRWPKRSQPTRRIPIRGRPLSCSIGKPSWQALAPGKAKDCPRSRDDCAHVR